jgi:di/tricarboxylate transporter
MTLEIILTLGILLAAIILFITELIRVDLVALIVLGALAMTGLISPDEALSGFSNPAVVTVWAVFILSGGLTATGVANIVGRWMLWLAGSGELRLIVLIMLISGVLSAFMNNVGVAAMLLPVVINLARRTERPASKLLMPLAYGSLLGGMTTLIGTPSNILASNVLEDAGFAPFGIFDFLPLGAALLAAGSIYMALFGRRLIPVRGRSASAADKSGDTYLLRSRLALIMLGEGSPLHGKTLAESRLGATLGLNVIGVQRNGKTQLDPGPHTELRSGDRLVVSGKLDRLNELQDQQYLVFDTDTITAESLFSDDVAIAELMLLKGAAIDGKTLQQLELRKIYGILALSLWRDGQLIRTEIDNIPLKTDDVLMVQGRISDLEKLHDIKSCLLSPATQRRLDLLTERLLAVTIPDNSSLIGRSLAESRLAEGIGMTVVGIARSDKTRLVLTPDMTFEANDRLLVKGKVQNLDALRGLQNLTVEEDVEPVIDDLESDNVGLVEVVLSPHTSLVGKTLRQHHFREKFGLTALAIKREERYFRTNLRDIALKFGDALLLHGPRHRQAVLRSEPDFVVLTDDLPEAPRRDKALLSVAIMAAVILAVIVNWLPISIAAIIGSVLMVLTGCLTMNEAYRYIEWRAVFLIAGMLPLGIAMESSGAAQFLANTVIGAIGGYGLTPLMVALFLLTALATQVMPNPVVTVLMAPIVLSTAADMSVSPVAFVVLTAIAASSSFLSPVGHPTNVLIMAPGGYKFSDYIRVGLPLMLLLLVLTILILPLIWPL